MLITPAPAKEYDRTLSVYGEEYAGKTMANGKPYEPEALTVASNDWKLGTELELIAKDIKVKVTVTDRMAKRFSGKRVDASRMVWRTLSKGAKPGLLKIKVKTL